MNTRWPGVRANVHFLAQGNALLERMRDEDYNRSRPGWSPVGAQFRHVIEHYQSFCAGLPDRRVDYDARAHNALIETCRTHAIDVAGTLQEQLETIGHLPDDFTIVIQMNSGGDAEGIPDWQSSSIGRELQFLSSHTVHHYALIKLLLEGLGIDAGPEFGVAPSTLAYERARALCAR